MKNFETFKTELTAEQRIDLLIHFNKHYECNELIEHELKIVYLAYLEKMSMSFVV
jgi:hypothetical protein